MNNYIIGYNDENFLVSAKSSLEAVTLWITTEQKQKKDEGRMIPFDPDISIKKLSGTVLKTE
ncbi:hypothetical protein ACFPYN_03135 [Paenisporosarcina macmurdoensis]|uniref:Uncharacterized protein n=1 Tax=Paenisporosarcina macmurdoensis TaxID=212659 RepID=A0ABW1L5N5_9BACL